MKEFQLRNIDNITAMTTNDGENVYHVKPLFDDDLMQKVTGAFVAIEPGSAAYGYHYHEVKEEVFYIISGEGSVRTINGEIAVKKGDVISFPTGKGGVHVIRNTSASENLIYLDFGSQDECEIVHLPDTKKIMVASKNTFAMYDEPSEARS